MFGAFRFLLASLVLVGHVFGADAHFVGVAAVVNFFLISGFVMNAMVHEHYSRPQKMPRYFYADRVLRIYPQYLFYVIATQLLAYYLKLDYWKVGPATASVFMLNALAVPVNYYMFFSGPAKILLVPPAWSLALEEQFYWLFPLLSSPRVKWLVVPLSAASFLIFALAATGVIPSEIFGYRLLPGVLFLFTIGGSLAEYNRNGSPLALNLIVGAYSACAALLVAVLAVPALHERNLIPAMLEGVVAGLPLVAFLSRLPRRRWDDMLANISYGVFLNHVLVLNLLYFFGVRHLNRGVFALVAEAVSAFLAYATYRVLERPVRKWRERIRTNYRRSNPPAAVAASSRAERAA